jgi:ferric-dicitrate binding protein FerR (iron transport regulator)
MNDQGGQATVEAVAAIPLLLAVGAVVLQLLVTGYAATLADGAAEAGALALADGRPVVATARSALPGWASERATVRVSGGEVTVRLSPPSPLPALTDRLAVSSSAFARRGVR